MIDRIQDALIPSVHRHAPTRKVGLGTAFAVELAGERFIFICRHDHDWDLFVVPPRKDGRLTGEHAMTRHKRMECEVVRRVRGLAIARWPKRDAGLRRVQPLCIDDFCSVDDISLGQTVWTMGFSGHEEKWPPQLRKGIVSAIPRREIIFDMHAVGSNSGAPIWTSEGVIATMQHIHKWRHEQPHPDDDRDGLGGYNTGLTSGYAMHGIVTTANEAAQGKREWRKVVGRGFAARP